MPEGHTLHRLARDHTRWFVGQPLVARSPQGRFAEQAAALDGRLLLAAEAYGKHLLHVWDHPHRPYVHIHLGLFGRVRHPKIPASAPRDSTRLLLATADRQLRLIGPTACEHLTVEGWERVRARLGDDPLRRDADPDRAFERLQRRRRPLAAVLMDQAVIAGLGNVYRAELLFVLGLDPWMPARELPRPTFDLLWTLARELLTEGVRLNRIVVAPRPEHSARRFAKRRLYVYKCQTCRVCGTDITRDDLEARRLYWCPTCQTAKAVAPPVSIDAIRAGLGTRSGGTRRSSR